MFFSPIYKFPLILGKIIFLNIARVFTVTFIILVVLNFLLWNRVQLNFKTPTGFFSNFFILNIHTEKKIFKIYRFTSKSRKFSNCCVLLTYKMNVFYLPTPSSPLSLGSFNEKSFLISKRKLKGLYPTKIKVIRNKTSNINFWTNYTVEQNVLPTKCHLANLPLTFCR